MRLQLTIITDKGSSGDEKELGVVQCAMGGSRFVTMQTEMRPLLESRPVLLDLSDPSSHNISLH